VKEGRQGATLGGMAGGGECEGGGEWRGVNGEKVAG
jgi:hypothetical protein